MNFAGRAEIISKSLPVFHFNNRDVFVAVFKIVQSNSRISIDAGRTPYKKGALHIHTQPKIRSSENTENFLIG